MSPEQTVIHSIDDAIARSSNDRRAQMARQLTELFLVNSEKYSHKETAIIDEVFVRLAASIEETSRALLASRLGPVSSAPPKILRALACDNAIFVASSVLMHSETLDELTVIECARTKGQEHLFAISRRKALSATITDVLLERGDHRVLLSAVQNNGAQFSAKGFTILVKRSKGDDGLSICVGTRPDLPHQLFLELLESASAAVRSKLEKESPHTKREVESAVTDVAKRVGIEATNGSQGYAAAKVLVDVLNRSGKLNPTKLEAFAKAEMLEETVVALAAMSAMPFDLVARTLDAEFAKFAMVLAKAIGLSLQATLTILKLGAKNHQCTENEIERGTTAFQRLTQQEAQRILATYRSNKLRPLGRRKPSTERLILRRTLSIPSKIKYFADRLRPSPKSGKRGFN